MHHLSHTSRCVIVRPTWVNPASAKLSGVHPRASAPNPHTAHFTIAPTCSVHHQLGRQRRPLPTGHILSLQHGPPCAAATAYDTGARSRAHRARVRGQQCAMCLCVGQQRLHIAASRACHYITGTRSATGLPLPTSCRIAEWLQAGCAHSWAALAWMLHVNMCLSNARSTAAPHPNGLCTLHTWGHASCVLPEALHRPTGTHAVQGMQ